MKKYKILEKVFLKLHVNFFKMSKRKLTDAENNSANKKKTGFWALGLLSSMEDPNLQVLSDDLIVVIKDKYPKAKYHYLVLPKENISSIKSLRQEHISLLRHMDKVAEELIKDKNENFKIGYHAQPNMERLHLHVISDDMNSVCLKTKQHWNSFTSKFFINSEDICKMLESDGKLTLPSADECKKLITQELKCHKCSYVPKTMPDLKKHILEHI